MQIVFDTPEIRRRLIEIKTYALSKPFDFSNGIPENYTPVGDDSRFVLNNGNIKIVYSVEIQPNPKLGICHHLSVSKENRALPHPEMVNFVMDLLGMGDIGDSRIRIVHIENEYAINILQPFS